MIESCWICGENVQTDGKFIWCTGDQCGMGVEKNIILLGDDGIGILPPKDRVYFAPIFYKREVDSGATWKSCDGTPMDMTDHKEDGPNPDWVSLHQ